MRTSWLTGIWFWALALASIGCGSGSSGALRWGADTEGGQPYVYIKDPAAKEIAGFEVDIKDALARELNRDIQFSQQEWETILEALRKNDIDFAMNGMEILPERKETVRFSRPYYVYRLQWVVRADDDRFGDPKDLLARKDQVKVSTLSNSAAERFLKKENFKNVAAFKDSVSAYEEVNLKQADACLQDLPIAIYLADDAKKFKFLGKGIEPGYYAIAFRKDDAALAAQVDAALDKLIKNGTLQRIYEKWKLWNDDQKELATWKSGD